MNYPVTSDCKLFNMAVWLVQRNLFTRFISVNLLCTTSNKNEKGNCFKH